MNTNQKFDQNTVNKVIENLNSATKTKIVRKSSSRGPSELTKTLDSLLPTVQERLKEGIRKKEIYGTIVRSGIKMSSATFNAWLHKNGLTKKKTSKQES